MWVCIGRCDAQYTCTDHKAHPYGQPYPPSVAVCWLCGVEKLVESPCTSDSGAETDEAGVVEVSEGVIVMGERGDRRAFGPASKSTLALVVVAVAGGAGATVEIPKSMSRMSKEDAS